MIFEFIHLKLFSKTIQSTKNTKTWNLLFIMYKQILYTKSNNKKINILNKYKTILSRKETMIYIFLHCMKTN